MQTAAKRAFEPPAESLVELPPHGRLPRLDLGVDWESPWQEFRTSVRDFFEKAYVPSENELPQDSHLRVHWIRGKNSGWAFAASSVWHVDRRGPADSADLGLSSGDGTQSRAGSDRGDVESFGARFAEDLSACAGPKSEALPAPPKVSHPPKLIRSQAPTRFIRARPFFPCP